MPLHNHPDRIRIAFDDHRLVANAGLILPTALAYHLNLPDMFEADCNGYSLPGGSSLECELYWQLIGYQ